MDIEQLCYACVYGDNDKVEEIMASGEVDINGTNSDGHTPLHHAIQYNHLSIVRTLLVSENTRLDVTDSCGWTGLHYALRCYNNYVECVKVFTSDTRCTDHVLNMKNNNGNTAVMWAVMWGYLDIVRVLAQLPGTDMCTKNSDGKTLMEVAIEGDHQNIVRFLEEQNSIEGAEGGARDTLDSFRLREIADQMDNIEAVEAAMAIKEEKHNEDIADLEEEIARQKLEMDRMKQKQKETLKEHANIRSANRMKKKKLQACLNPSAPPVPTPDFPECPVCFEEMKPPLEIFNCRNGHLICSVCRPRLSICTNWRAEYTGRATAVEQMIRQMLNMQ
jgi:hypothetical protein